jgi:Arc/MetJ-type ribon-helix-helix transcriptional regulator
MVRPIEKDISTMLKQTAAPDKTRNLTVEFSQEALDMLESLRQKLGKKSKSEVLRTAVLLLNFVQKQREAGHQLAVVQQDDQVKLVELLV